MKNLPDASARFHAWTPFAELVGSSFKVLDIEIVTVGTTNPSPFTVRLQFPDDREPTQVLLSALDSSTYRILGGDTAGNLPLPFGTVIELGLDGGRVVVTRIVERSRWWSAFLYATTEEVDETALAVVAQRVRDSGGYFYDADGGYGSRVQLHFLPDSAYDPLDELRKLGFRRQS
ncbi:MAG: hypothetical protein AAF581_16055 [Planctomycetota bacterium]